RGAGAVFRQRLRRHAARARGLLRPPLQYPFHRAGKGGPRQFPERAVMGRPLSRRRFPAARLALAAALAFALAPQLRAAPPEPGERISFVSCPIIRDTRTVPCWLSE